MAINKVVYGENTLIDLTDTTATADKILTGYGAYGADGVWMNGTATAGGSVTQDQDGFIVLPSTGGGGGGSSGLVFEQGTWTPTTSVSSYVLDFADTHTEAPFMYMVVDATNSYDGTTNRGFVVMYHNFHQLTGVPFNVDNNGTANYGYVAVRYRNTSTSSTSASYPLTYPYTNSGATNNTYSRYWATETGIRAECPNRSWNENHTYKWIAVWKPTT